eukprot:scaffold398060_cov19-Prasinocladus_malaysianus.AAC.1
MCYAVFNANKPILVVSASSSYQSIDKHDLLTDRPVQGDSPCSSMRTVCDTVKYRERLTSVRSKIVIVIRSAGGELYGSITVLRAQRLIVVFQAGSDA